MEDHHVLDIQNSIHMYSLQYTFYCVSRQIFLIGLKLIIHTVYAQNIV